MASSRSPIGALVAGTGAVVAAAAVEGAMVEASGLDFSPVNVVAPCILTLILVRIRALLPSLPEEAPSLEPGEHVVAGGLHSSRWSFEALLLSRSRNRSCLS